MKNSPIQAQLVEYLEHPFPVYHYLWPNGLRLLLQPDHGAPVVSYQTWVQVGSANEQKGKTGIAHFFEHLMFKATHNHAEGEFDRILEEVGGEVNAGTWLDWTYYYVDLPSSHLEKVIVLEADRLSQLNLNDEVLEAERQVVLNERRECVEDDPSEVMSESLWYNLMGDGHPYAHSTIGWMDDIQAITLEDCIDFYERYYSPNQVTLVVSGDVTADRLLPLIEQYYAHLPSKTGYNDLEFKPPEKTEIESITMKLDLHSPRVHLGFQVPSLLDSTSIIFECLDELLFEGDSSRLYKKLVYDLELATYVYSMLPQFREKAVYEVGIELIAGQDPDQVIKVILEELEHIAEHGVSNDELERVKCSKELNNYRSLQTVQQRAQNLGFWQTTANDFKLNFSRLEQIDKVSSEEIKTVTQHLLKPQARLIMFGLPNHQDSEMS